MFQGSGADNPRNSITLAAKEDRRRFADPVVLFKVFS
jgi:hypothetical protein